MSSSCTSLNFQFPRIYPRQTISFLIPSRIFMLIVIVPIHKIVDFSDFLILSIRKFMRFSHSFSKFFFFRASNFSLSKFSNLCIIFINSPLREFLNSIYKYSQIFQLQISKCKQQYNNTSQRRHIWTNFYEPV